MQVNKWLGAREKRDFNGRRNRKALKGTKDSDGHPSAIRPRSGQLYRKRGSVALAAAVLGCLGAAAIAVATKWPRVFPALAGAGLLGLTGLSVWMFTSLKEAREGFFVFGVTVVVLVLMALFIKLFSKHKMP